MLTHNLLGLATVTLYGIYTVPYYGSCHCTIDVMGELIIWPFLYDLCMGG